jgi:hypothetical protein
MKQRVYSASVVLSAIALAVSGAAQADQAIDCNGLTTCEITITPDGGPDYRITTDAGGIGIGDGPGGLPLVIVAGAPQGALVVDSSGNLSLGPNQNQTASLRIRRNNGTAKLLVQEQSGTVASRRLLELRNNGPIGFAMINTNTGDEWRFAAQTTGFRITNASSPSPDFEVLSNGDAVLRGTLTEGSDVNVKSNIEALDGNLVLAKLDAMPVTEWSYRWESPSVRHIGPMAQDFHAAFGLGTDETKISPRDMAGVSMAAVKALRVELMERDAEIATQREQISALQARLSELDQLKDQIAAIESRLPHQMATRN